MANHKVMTPTLRLTTGFDVRNEWSYTSSPTLRHQGVDRDSFSVFVNKEPTLRFNSKILTFLIEIK